MEELMIVQAPGTGGSPDAYVRPHSNLQGAVKLSFSRAEKNSGAVTTL